MQRPIRPGQDGGGVARPLPGRPGDGGGGIERPTRPGQGGGGIERPTRPGEGGGGIERPTRPGQGGGGIERPTRPGEGGGGIERPTRPGQGGGGIERPTRPGQGGGGIERPTRPGQGGGGEQWRPGDGNRPGWNRPGGGGGGTQWPNHPNYRPGNRPNFNNRPGWAQIGNNTINNINNNWNTVLNRPGANPWFRPQPAWINHWNNWGSPIRNNWWHSRWHNGWFNNNWWTGRWQNWGAWHYGYAWGNFGWRHWWTIPVWTSLNPWFNWSSGANAWQEPIFYDYGPGGNVVYQDNSVYIGGEQIASAQDFAASAAALATVPPPATEEDAEAAEWMPLGTFALSTNEKETDPSRVIQLAVDRNGVVSGTLYNYDTDHTQIIQGQVDKETQRVAFRIGDSDDLVAETGLYNLTQEEVPLLVHYGPDRTETYLLVRLEAPPEEQGQQ